MLLVQLFSSTNSILNLLNGYGLLNATRSFTLQYSMSSQVSELSSFYGGTIRKCYGHYDISQLQ